MIFFPRFVKAELIKLAGMAGVMHETQITLTLSVAPGDYIDVPSIACVINWQSIFVNNLDLSNFLLESGLPYFDFYLSVSCWSIL